MTQRDLEHRSSAITLSDMELFIFPDLIYSLVLANIMSPRIWKWREDPWFAGMKTMTPYRRISRVKQYIMDHYVFNLDLDTWGLTTKERELARFDAFINRNALEQSNALFGYEGDRYYFDMDIRAHFGLDKYDGSVIPYWKTETVEAMDAFRLKPGYSTGAGECVSLSTLYAAALFLVARIPLSDIFLMATPLHSQNYVDVEDGILTNNRRLVTHKMWFNGTVLSAQARRALENEQVTLVAHETGIIHCLYDEASIRPAAYDRFQTKLRSFLTTRLSVELLGNFLRHNRDLQKCFQVRWQLHDRDHYIGAEEAFAYEEDSSFSLTGSTRDRLMSEIDREAFADRPLSKRIVLNDLESFLRSNPIDIHNPVDALRLKARFACDCFNAEKAIEALVRFCHTQPRLPDPATKRFITFTEPLQLTLDMTREDMIRRLDTIRSGNPVADLAFYAFRDLSRTEPEPFFLAALSRNPVSVEAARGSDDEALPSLALGLSPQSIYDEPERLAQPDEVWNFGSGDGLERLILLANLVRSRKPELPMALSVYHQTATLKAGDSTWSAPTSKRVRFSNLRLAPSLDSTPGYGNPR